MKKFTCVLFAGVFAFQSVITVGATTAQEKKDEAESSLNSVTNSIDVLESSKSTAEDAVDDLSDQLVEVIANIAIAKDELVSKKAELKEVKAELKEAEAEEEEQYVAMKARIQYMYEDGDSTVMDAILGSESIADLLNNVEYADSINDYDRQLLESYQAAVDAVTAKKEEVESEKAELEEMQAEYESQQDSLNALIDEKQATIADFDEQLAAAEAEAEDLRQDLEDATAALKAEQAAAAAAATTTTTTSSSTASSTSSSSSSTTTAAATTTTTTTTTTSSSGTGQSVANYACQFIGNPYVWGGTSLTNGADCSGFVMSVYAHFGVSLPHSSGALASVGTGVSYSSAQPGDIICYSGHVGIYIGGGQIVNASNAATGIKTQSATYRTIVAVRRIF